jgi:hypothetical protein
VEAVLLTLTKLRSENRGSLGNFQATYTPIFLSAAVRFFNRSVTVRTRKWHNAKRHLITK